MAVCKFCHIQIGDRAQQCFACGWDWHSEGNPVQRGVIDWARYGLDQDITCVAVLCETESGDRYMEYRSPTCENDNCDFVIESLPQHSQTIRETNFVGIEHHLVLSDGERFWFDDFGQWQTNSKSKRVGWIDRTWNESTDGFISQEAAIELATAYGRSLGILPFHVEYANLINNLGKPEWAIPLFFNDLDLGDSCVFVSVDARTGTATHIQNM